MPKEIKMKIKRVGLKNEHDITKVSVIYGLLTSEERKEFYERLLNFDVKGETGKYGKFVREKVAPAVLSGECKNGRVLKIARNEHFYFMREKKEAARAA